jgi:hypothetical protein
MKHTYCIKILFCLTAALMLFVCPVAQAENIDPNNDNSQFAYGENNCWLNFEPVLGRVLRSLPQNLQVMSGLKISAG